MTHAVTLAAKTYDVNFIVDPVGADFTLTQGEGEDAKTVAPKTAKDKDGKIVYSHTGYSPGSENELLKKIKELKK